MKHLAVCLMVQTLVVEFIYRVFGIVIVCEGNLYICLSIAYAFFGRYMILYVLGEDTEGWLAYAGSMFLIYILDCCILYTDYVDIGGIRILGVFGGIINLAYLFEIF